MCPALTLRKYAGIFKLIRLVELAKIAVTRAGTASLGTFLQNLSVNFKSPFLSVNMNWYHALKSTFT